MSTDRLSAQIDLVEVLDRLPFGILVVEAERVCTMNATARSLLGGNFKTMESLVETCPSAEVLITAPGRSARHWLSVGAGTFLVDALPIGRVTLFTLVPLAYLDPQDAPLRELCQLHGDYQEIFDNCFDGIYVADGAGRSLWLNPGFERTYGLNGHDFIGRDAGELERLGFIKPLITWKVIATKQRQTALQQTKSGRRVLATGIPLLDDFGKVRKVIINSRDLTDLMTLQDRLVETEADLARTQLALARLQREQHSDETVTFASQAMNHVTELIGRLGEVDTTVLIQGESGVGKDVVARAIHAKGSRQGKAFVKINCGAIPAELLESELFGYESGAFSGARKQGKPGTFEAAHQGTLFLDEIGDMPLLLQVKLLQVLQDRTLTRLGGTRSVAVDFRLIAATNRDLKAMIAQRTFREDLFYRLNVVPLEIPPLRERPEDVIALAHRFLDEFNARYGYSRRFTGATMEQMLSYRWPGNVRELRNVVERLAVTATENDIDLKRFPHGIFDDSPSNRESSQAVLGAPGPGPVALRSARAARDVEMVQEAVRQHGSIQRAAEQLGVSVSTVKRRLRDGREGSADPL